MAIMFNGIDVSTHQGYIDWDKVKGKVDFAIIRAGYGNNHVDTQLANNIKGCEKNGIPFGFYWFSYAETIEEARKEAKYLLKAIEGHTPLYPLFFDFEYDSMNYAKRQGTIITKEYLRQMAIAFCEELENAGYYAGIYANKDYATNMYGDGIFNTYDLWYAQWGVSKPSRSVHLWQDSDSGYIPGIIGKVDTNKAFIDFPEIIKSKGLNGYKVNTFKCPLGYTDCPHAGK